MHYPGDPETCHVCHGHGELPAGENERARADAQVLADVRTLDEWKAASPERSVVLDGDGHFWCRLGDWPRPGIRDMRGFDAPTPDVARAKAAAWVREQSK